MSAFGGILITVLAFTAAVLLLIFVVVPIFKGIGWMIAAVFRGIGWLITHIFQFVAGMLTDIVRFVGAIIAWIVLLPLVLLNVVIGRWSASGHFARSMKRELQVAGTCFYRVTLQRPLRFLLLGGLLEGLEQRVNEAVDAAPTADRPRGRTGVFEGYTIVGSLPGGGSGAKLYIAKPDKGRHQPDRVVIKSFTLSDGSSLPQIVRESRALEAAKQLGLVLDHAMDEHRFYYVMPYHQGDHLGIVTRQLHGRADAQGLSERQLAVVFGYLGDLIQTLSRYHRGGLWHKDVKPDNIIVHDNRAHLVDLGLVTPLRSAMTLTTHGTEYFRDPEMVRMALRGVKVHQVDGAKFDIYAVGAVMYFVVENTFPAHGGLSAFSKRSPEALRWIIRRAMADYNKRYETTEALLADLQCVAAAAHPFAVKPAELPSMGGAEAVEMAAEEEEVGETVAMAGSPKPPKEKEKEVKAWVFAAGTDVQVDPEKANVAVAGWGVQAGPGGIKVGKLSPEPSGGPKLRVTNWWTGAYEVEGAVAPGRGGPFGPDARALRKQARELRQQSAFLRKQVGHGRMSARRAAREQIKSARARAREMGRRARAHRYKTVGERPPVGVGVLVAVTIAILGTFLFLRMRSPDERREIYYGDQAMTMSVSPAPEIQAPLATSLGGSLVLLVVNDHPASTNPHVSAQVARMVKEYRDRGWVVLVDDQDAEVAVRECLPAGIDAPLPALLQKTMLDYKLGGVLQITSGPGEGEPHERFATRVIVTTPTGVFQVTDDSSD